MSTKNEEGTGMEKRQLPHLIVEQISISSENQTGDKHCPRSPITIQEWVDSIEFNKSAEEYLHSEEQVCLDTFRLGAEASYSEEGRFKTGDKLSAESEPQDNNVFNTNVRSTGQGLSNRRLSLLQMRDQQGSLQSDVSSQSSLSSIETLLEARREDPEEILLNLGFGGSNEPVDPLARIPKRFLKPSRVKGNSLDEFVRHQEELLETLDSGFCGYRGLSGWSTSFSTSLCPLCPLVFSALDDEDADDDEDEADECVMEICVVRNSQQDSWTDSPVQCWCK